MNYLLPERLDRLAREYALGTLHGPARRRFERVVRQSAAATLAVGAWQERLASLAGSVPVMQPSDAVWKGLERRLFASRAGPVAPRRRFAAFLSWPSLGAALAGALLMALVLHLQPALIGAEPMSEVLPASYVGLLTDAAGKPTVLASSRRQGRRMTVKMLQPLGVPPGQVAQLWALPKGDAAPFPVGVLPSQGSAEVVLADTSEKLFFQVPRLGVTFEAAPVQPGGRPAGPFVLIGHCVKLW